MRNRPWKEVLLRLVSLIPLLLVAAALTCPATDLEPAWNGRDAGAGDRAAATDTAGDSDAAVSVSDVAPTGEAVETAPAAPPALVPLACEPGEIAAEGACVLPGTRSAVVRCLFDRPADAGLSCRTPAGDAVVLSPISAPEHRMIVAPLAPDAAQECTLYAANAAGDAAPAVLRFSTARPSGPWLAVTEVMANPPGSEPAQEWVEIANLGDVAVDLANWRLEDEGGGADLPAGTRLPPGAVALLVPDAFVPGAGGDVFPNAAARLVRVGRSLGTSGLRNSGEAVFLVGPAGAVVSSYPNVLGAAADGVSVERRPAIGPEEDLSAWVFSGDDGPSPGWVR
jgi:hypothetical protein